MVGETPSTRDVSLLPRTAMTDFGAAAAPVDTAVSLVPLLAGTANAVRLSRYEEVRPGRLLPRGDARRRGPPLDSAPARARRTPGPPAVRYAWGKTVRVWAD